MTPFHRAISNFEKKYYAVVNKRIFLPKFSVIKFFHESVSYVKNGT